MARPVLHRKHANLSLHRSCCSEYTGDSTTFGADATCPKVDRQSTDVEREPVDSASEVGAKTWRIARKILIWHSHADTFRLRESHTRFPSFRLLEPSSVYRTTAAHRPSLAHVSPTCSHPHPRRTDELLWQPVVGFPPRDMRSDPRNDRCAPRRRPRIA